MVQDRSAPAMTCLKSMLPATTRTVINGVVGSIEVILFSPSLAEYNYKSYIKASDQSGYGLSQ